MSKSLKNISIVATATVVSRVLGLVREMVTAAVFGASALNSAFVSAFTLPNLFRRLLGEGALTAAFVPALAGELEEKQHAGAFALVSKVSSWLLVVTSVLVAGCVALLLNSTALLRMAEGWGLNVGTGGRLLLGADLAVVLFPYMILVCLAAAFSAACQVLGRFTEPALSPVWLNLAILTALGIGAALAWDAPRRMGYLCGGVLVGGFFQMAVPAAVLWREGWRPVFDLKPDARVREIVRLMAPTVIGSAVYLINIAVSRVIALSLNDSAATVLNLSTRVMELPIGVFTAAIAAVVFPLISRHAARGEWAAFAGDYHKGLRLVTVVNLPAAAGLAILSEPVTRLLFQRGAFSAADTSLMTPVLSVYALGLPFLSFSTVALRGYYALKDTATPVRAAVLSFIVNLVLSLLLIRWLSTAGLALAGTLAVVAQVSYLQANLVRKQSALRLAPLLPNLAKIILATALMGAVVWACLRGVQTLRLPHRAADLAIVCGVIPVGALLYGGLLWLLRIEGREDVEMLISRLRRRRSAETVSQ